MAITRETFFDRRQPSLRWGAVFAGGAVGIGLWILLQVLGAGIGLSAIDPADAGTLRGAGIGTGIWSVLAPLIALFTGGYLAARLSGSFDRRVGAIHGVVLWAMTIVLGLLALTSVVSGLTRGAVAIGRDAATLTGEPPPWVKMEPGPITEQDQTAMAATADKVGKVMLWSGLGLLLSMLAAAGGGALGAHLDRRTGWRGPGPDRLERERLDRERLELERERLARERTITPARGVGVAMPPGASVVDTQRWRGDE